MNFLLQISDCKFGWLTVLAICLLIFISGLIHSLLDHLENREEKSVSVRPCSSPKEKEAQ